MVAAKTNSPMSADPSFFLVRVYEIIAQVTDEGNLECLYHGWQFEGAGGSCLKIPQVCAAMVGSRFQ